MRYIQTVEPVDKSVFCHVRDTIMWISRWTMWMDMRICRRADGNDYSVVCAGGALARRARAWYNLGMNESEFYRRTRDGGLAGAYLLYGQEELTRHEAVARVVETTDAAYRDLNVEYLDQPTWRALSDAAARLPFFDTVRVAVVKSFRDEEVLPHAEELMGLPAGVVVLLQRQGELRKDSLLRRAFEDADRAVEFASLTPDRAAALLLREAGLLGVSLDRGTARALCEMTGLDANALKNELAKAAGYVGRGGTVTRETLDKVVRATPEYRIFDMLNAFLAGRRRQGLAQLYGMLAEGQSALGLASFLSNRMKQLHLARALVDKGLRAPEIKARLGGSSFAADKTLQGAKQRDAATFARCVSAFAGVDAALKTGEADEVTSLLAAALGTLCQ